MTTATQQQNRSNASFAGLCNGSSARTPQSQTGQSPYLPTTASASAKPKRTFIDVFLKAMSAFAA